MWTASIRRKLLFGLGLVFLILLLLTAGGFYLLKSYDTVVGELDRVVNQASGRARAQEAAFEIRREAGRYAAVFAVPEKRSPQANLSTARATLNERLDELESAVSAFQAGLDAQPLGTGDNLRGLVMSLVIDIENRQLHELSQAVQQLETAEEPAPLLEEIRDRADGVFTALFELPETAADLQVPLDKARKFREAGTRTLGIIAAASLLLLFGLMRCGYRWIFRPVRSLYQGTSRVAQGDFDYRIRIDSNDEMGELAEAFNKMTVRFQEITRDLDRQVRERSKQLIRSERLAGIGFLASGVAHEINNPLTGISVAAQSLLQRKHELLAPLSDEDREDVEDYLQIIDSESRQCQSITRRLLDFARGEGQQRSQFDLTELIREVLNLASHMSRFRHCRLVFEHEAACTIEGNRTEIKQVVLNLVANGLEAMEAAGGTLTVELVEATDQVEIRVRDEGSGMTADVMEHLFEPFFTHNKPGKGTGLGMAITHRIISDHGGTIEPQSAGPNSGSTFLVHLPRAAAQSRAA